MSDRAEALADDEDGDFTEAICGDGAAILFCGMPIGISQILAMLNAAHAEGEDGRPVRRHA